MSQDLTQAESCLVVLTDPLYLPGTQRLVESFFDHNQALPIVVLSDTASVFENPFWNRYTVTFKEISCERYTDIRPYKKRHSQRHSRTFYKIEAFADFGFSRNLFLDSDILCLAPTPLLFQNNTVSLLAARDSGFRKTRAYKGSENEINSGVLLIDKSIQGTETINQLLEIAKNRPGRGGYNSGDQGIINKWIREFKVELGLLPESYNLIKKNYDDQSGLESCKLLHFADRKPWFPSPDALGSTQQPLIKLWHTTDKPPINPRSQAEL